LEKWGLYDEDWHAKTENRLEYPNGTDVILESAANLQKVERLRGLNIAAAWLDEIGEHFEKTYHVIGDRLRTGEYRNLYGTGTPKGKNWVYDECVAPLENDPDATTTPVESGQMLANEHMTAIKGVSTRANRATPEDYKDSRERQHSGHSYKQEIQGEFVDPEGVIYDWWDSELVTHELPEDYTRTLYGVDWGFNSPSAAVVILETSDGYHIADELYARGLTTQDLAGELDSLVSEWGTGPIYCDPAEPANIETLRRAGLNVKQAENDVLPGIQCVTSNRHGLTVHEQCRNWRNEIQGYEWKGDGADKPVKANDHLMDAMRYALFTDASGTDAGMYALDL